MQGRRMFGLIEADLASTRQFDLRDGTPSLFVNSGAVDVLAREGGYLGFEIANRFAVGYGLDHAQHYRNLEYVAALDA